MSSLMCILGRPGASVDPEEEQDPTPYRPPLRTRRFVKNNGVEIMVRGHSVLKFPDAEETTVASEDATADIANFKYKYPTDDPVGRSPRCTDRLSLVGGGTATSYHSQASLAPSATLVQQESRVVVEQFGQRTTLTQTKPVLLTTPPRKSFFHNKHMFNSRSGSSMEGSCVVLRGKPNTAKYSATQSPSTSTADTPSSNEDDEYEDYHEADFSSGDDESSFLPPPAVVRVLSRPPPAWHGVEAVIQQPDRKRFHNNFLRAGHNNRNISSKHVASIPTHRTVSSLSLATESLASSRHSGYKRESASKGERHLLQDQEDIWMVPSTASGRRIVFL